MAKLIYAPSLDSYINSSAKNASAIAFTKDGWIVTLDNKFYAPTITDSLGSEIIKLLDLSGKYGARTLTLQLANLKAYTSNIFNTIVLKGDTATTSDAGVVTILNAFDKKTANTTTHLVGNWNALKGVYDEALKDAKDYTDSQIKSGIAASDAMIFMGTIDSNNNITGFNTQAANKAFGSTDYENITSLTKLTKYKAGWTFKFSAANESWKAEAGDMLITTSDQENMLINSKTATVIQSNLQNGIERNSTDLKKAGITYLTAENNLLNVIEYSSGNNTNIYTTGVSVLSYDNSKPVWKKIIERDIKVKGTSIGNYALNFNADKNIDITNSNGLITFKSLTKLNIIVGNSKEYTVGDESVSKHNPLIFSDHFLKKSDNIIKINIALRDLSDTKNTEGAYLLNHRKIQIPVIDVNKTTISYGQLSDGDNQISDLKFSDSFGWNGESVTLMWTELDADGNIKLYTI